MTNTRFQIYQTLSHKAKLLFNSFQDSPSATVSSPQSVVESPHWTGDQRRHGRYISASEALCAQMSASATFASSEQYAGDRPQVVKSAGEPHAYDGRPESLVRQKNKMRIKTGRVQVRKILGSGRRVGKSTTNIYTKYIKKAHHARTASMESRPDTAAEVTEVDELPAYISLKKRQSVIYEDTIEQVESSSLSSASPELKAHTNQATQDFSLPTPPASTYGGRDSPTQVRIHTPLTPPRSPSDQPLCISPPPDTASYSSPDTSDISTAASPVISGSVVPRGRARARAPTHRSTASDLDSPPHLTSTHKSPRLRLFPTPTPTESLPLPAYKRLSLYPDSNGSALLPLAQVPGRRLSISTVSSAPQLGASPAHVSRNPNRNSLPPCATPVSMPSQVTSKPVRPKEDNAAASLREWELATFALRYEDTAILGEPFHTAKAAELWMNTRGKNGSRSRRRLGF